MKQLSKEELRQMNQRRYENKVKSYNRYLLKRKEKMNKYFCVNQNLQLVETSNRIGSQRNILRVEVARWSGWRGGR